MQVQFAGGDGANARVSWVLDPACELGVRACLAQVKQIRRVHAYVRVCVRLYLDLVCGGLGRVRSAPEVIIPIVDVT